MLADRDSIAFVATTQPEQVRVFYSEVLGSRLTEDSPFALVYDAHGTMLRIQRVQILTPARHTTLGWHVVDVHEAWSICRNEASSSIAIQATYKMSGGFGPLPMGIQSRSSLIWMGILCP
jgi:hypothetical protein